MPTVRNSDLLNALNRQAQDSVKRADANATGVLTVAEQAQVTASVRDNVQSHREGAGTVRVDAFASSFATHAKSEISRVDLNRDGLLSPAEQSKLAANLQDNLRELLGTPAPSQPTTPTQPATPASTKPAFGISGTVPASKVKVTTILANGLSNPSSLAFNPNDKSLWIVNRGDDSSVVLDNVGTSSMRGTKYRDDSNHFMNNPMQIAFSGSRNEFATVQDTDNDYNGHAAGNMFMGPTVFTADRKVFNGGEASHLDMLHHSPVSVGIAAGKKTAATQDKREYWVFNGQTGSVDRYYFNQPHELGGHDHSDGQTFRYGSGLKRVPGVPGHVAFDEATNTVFVADTGNGRIAKLDASKYDPRQSTQVRGHHDETKLYQVTGSKLDSVTGATAGLKNPSGLIIKDGLLVVGDYATGKIKVFAKDGTLKGEVDTGVGPKALTGLAAGPDGKLYFLDSAKGRLLQLEISA